MSKLMSLLKYRLTFSELPRHSATIWYVGSTLLVLAGPIRWVYGDPLFALDVWTQAQAWVWAVAFLVFATSLRGSGEASGSALWAVPLHAIVPFGAGFAALLLINDVPISRVVALMSVAGSLVLACLPALLGRRIGAAAAVLAIVAVPIMAIASDAPPEPTPVMAERGDTTTVLVTGANRGIGLEFARQYRARGYRVIGTARSPDRAEDLRMLGARVEQLDIADTESVRALAERLQGQPIDILINNAGIRGHEARTLQDLQVDSLSWAFDVNSLGALRVTQALLDNLRRGDAKKIVSISSTMGSVRLNRVGGDYGYRTTKAALNMITKSLAGELAKDGMVVVALNPGWVQTDLGGERAPMTPEESISQLIALIDEMSRRVNGSFLDYDGRVIPW